MANQPIVTVCVCCCELVITLPTANIPWYIIVVVVVVVVVVNVVVVVVVVGPWCASFFAGKSSCSLLFFPRKYTTHYSTVSHIPLYFMYSTVLRRHHWGPRRVILFI